MMNQVTSIKKARPDYLRARLNLFQKSVRVFRRAGFLKRHRLFFLRCQDFKSVPEFFLVKEMHASEIKVAGNIIQLLVHGLNRNVKNGCNFLGGKIKGGFHRA